MGFVALILTLAAVGRLILAARGWPDFESDEAVVGLMTDDILRHGAHPVYFYGQNYMGALQAYLAAPFFLLLGATPFAVLATATVETALFIFVLYLFTREVFTREVALCALLLLAAGPFSALRAELHVGAGEHDTLPFGALILLLVVLRLRGRRNLLARLALDAGIGFVIGLALWGDFLILPFVLAAGLALASRAAWRVVVDRERASRRRSRLRLSAETGVAAVFFLIGLTPLLLANIASQGATFREVFGAANSPDARFSPPLPPGLAGAVQALYLQVAATVLVGLPHAMGDDVLCGRCAIWPLATAGTPAGSLVWTAVVAIGFTALAIFCWALAAAPLARDAARDARRALMAGRQRMETLRAASGTYDVRWWGRAMLVLGAMGTVAQYALTHAAYIYPITSARYLVGLLLCTPLVAALLLAGLQAGWRWARARFTPVWRQTPRWPPRIAIASSVLLATLIALNVSGWRLAFAQASDPAAFGQPDSQRHVALIAYLHERHITRFYTDYWTCYKVVFATDQRVACAVFHDDGVFRLGTTRVQAMSDLVTAKPHAPYIFDPTSSARRPLPSDMGIAPVLFSPVRLPFLRLSGRIGSNGSANRAQDLQVQTRAYSHPGAGAWACAWRVPGVCRWLYNTALEQRNTAWQRARISVSRFQQEAELKDIRADMPEYAAIHSHVLQDVLARLDKTSQAFFRRVKAGEQAGFPRYQARTRWHSFALVRTRSPTRSSATERRWTTAFWCCRRSGGLRSVGRVQWRALPRRSRSAGKRMGGMSASPAWMFLCGPGVRLDRKPASIWAWKLLPPSPMAHVSSRRVGIARPSVRSKPPKGASHVARRAAHAAARLLRCSPRRIKR